MSMPINTQSSFVLLVRSIIMSTITSTMLISCHSSDNYYSDGKGDPADTKEPVKKSTLIKSALVADMTGNKILESLKDVDPQTHAVTPVTKCDVVVKKYTFKTHGVKDEATKSTAAIMIPKGNSPECQGDRPILLYAHGTTVSKSYDLSQVNNPNNPATGRSLGIAANFSAQGYIVVAPNYAGYDESDLDYHPYLNAKQQSHEMEDALIAAKELLISEQEASASEKLFITGYSQGGHVALATARYFDTVGIPVTATVPMSGPYAMTAFGDSIFSGKVNLGATVFGPLIAVNYNKDYGNIYNKASDIVIGKYAESLEGLIPGNFTTNELLFSGKIPISAMFKSNPAESDLLANISPADPKYGFGFSEDDYLIKTEFREDYVKDARDNPDGYISKAESYLPPTNPQHPLRQALKKNDLRLYVPKHPVLLCGGNQDPMVFFDVNVDPMIQLWQKQSADSKKLNVITVDVDTMNQSERGVATVNYIGSATTLQTSLDPVISLAQTNFESSFFEAKGNKLLYHSTLVAPACLTVAKSYFDELSK